MVFSGQLGELNSIAKVAEACHDNAFGAHLNVIDPEINVQLHAYVQREHHLYETTAEGEISDLCANRRGIPLHMYLYFHSDLLSRLLPTLLRAWLGGVVGNGRGHTAFPQCARVWWRPLTACRVMLQRY